MKQRPHSTVVASCLNSDKEVWHTPGMEDSVRNSLSNQSPVLESDVLIWSTDSVDSSLKKNSTGRSACEEK